ncbi:hypothetical protein COURTHOUSE_70 [Mycobacterium phage Courthouse]|uniref:Uncharacterized protein n=1 Tax=Mycobacterium phage Courthouse TaxID=2923000 RepID=G8I5C7_9CAUD|nr:hypothetical protein CM09_gp070 [Mycobacterium phage Courthouse]AER47921.1 hypothetical protein COURTHOUSE_70 [Mycobacterium phage Courthouse]
MSSEAQNVIADVIGKHRPIDSRDGEDGLCSCGWQEGVRWGPPTCAEHLAEEIDKALGGLTRRWGVVIEHPPRPADGYPGAVVELDSYKLREAAEITKRDQWPDDCYEVRSRWVSGWSEA